MVLTDLRREAIIGVKWDDLLFGISENDKSLQLSNSMDR